MYQQTQIKINFDEIFSDEGHLSQISTSFNQSAAQPQPQPRPLLSHSLIILPSESHNITLSSVKDYKMNKVSTKINISAEQQLLSLTRLIQQKQMPVKKLIKPSHVPITQKLSRQTPSECKKCEKHSHSKSNKQQAAQVKITKYKNPIRNTNLSRSQSNGNVYQRLYNHSKINALKAAYVTNSPKQSSEKSISKSQTKSLSNSRYLKSYIPFETRLKDYLNRSNEKEKVLKSNPQFAIGDIDKYFKPKLIPSKYTGKIASRYNNYQARELNSREVADFFNSSVSSSASANNQQIANRVQEHFFQKMSFIFQDKSSQWISVKEDIISLLTGVQFRILQPFIMWIEQHPIRTVQFEYNLRMFYDSLSPSEKRQLRDHQSKKKNKYIELKQSHIKPPKKIIESRVSIKPKKTVKCTSNYDSLINSYF